MNVIKLLVLSLLIALYLISYLLVVIILFYDDHQIIRIGLVARIVIAFRCMLKCYILNLCKLL